MANRNKQRGYELERETVLFWREHGAEVQRNVGSGAFKNYSADLAGDVKLGPYVIECKRKKSGYRFLYQSLDQDEVNDMLCIREDRQRRLYVLEEETLLDLMRKAGLCSAP